MLIDFSRETKRQRYHLMSRIVVPRPIAWVVTEGPVRNIAPFSYFTPLSSEPATVLISIGHKADGSPKDTLRNLRENGRCTICMIEEAHLRPMDQSSQPLGEDESELSRFGIPSHSILPDYPPVPTGIKAAMFGTYLQEMDLKGSATVPVVITIEHLFIDAAILTDPQSLALSLDTVARVGDHYTRLGSDFVL